jgi:phosphoglycerol transferase MdoB-like AlkP superfamily enzyme
MTLSSHEPFDYPKGKIKPYKNAPLEGFENSIKYADYALGKFFDRLQKDGLLKNTVIAFIADHNENTYGNTGVPIHKYKIPAVIYHDGIIKYKYNKIASQIDFVPTVLDVAGVNYTTPTMGDSIFRSQKNSAMLWYNKNFAYILDDKYILYQPNKQPKVYDYNNNKLSNNRSLIDDGLSYIYGSYKLYNNKYNIKKEDK